MFRYRSIIIIVIFVSFGLKLFSFNNKSVSIQDSTTTITNDIKNQLSLAEELKNSDVKQAITLAREALTKAEHINNTTLIAESKLTLGIYYEYLGGHIEALGYLTDALSLFNQLNDKVKIAKTNKEIGNVYYYTNKHDIALSFYENSYKCGIGAKDTLLIIESLIGRGSVYGNTNRLDSALILFNESFALAQKLGDKTTEVQSLFYIGDVDLYSGKPHNALKVFHLVENNYNLRKINSRIIPSLNNSITKAYLDIGDLLNAKVYNQKTKESLEEIPRLTNKLDYYLLKYQIDTIERNFEAAIRSFEAYKNLGDSINSSTFKEKLGNIETLYELERKEREIEILTNENKLKDISIKQKRVINYGSLAFMVLFLVLTIQAIRTAKKIRGKNTLLQEQQEELAAANEELSSTNEELFNQRAELESVLNHLKNTQTQLVQSEKMASLGVLAAGVAHEINNPLNFIKGGITGIEDFVKENLKNKDSELRPLIEGIHIGVERAAAIVISLNQYSRHDDSPQINSNLHSIIDNCLVMLHNQMKNRIEVTKNYTADPCFIKCNESKLHQVFLNILANAAQAIEKEGKIVINTKSDSSKIYVSIKDSGEGIGKENLSKIFDPFFTTKDPGKGTGLGLSITYKILQEHNAIINFDSEPNKGTDVTIIFPNK